MAGAEFPNSEAATGDSVETALGPQVPRLSSEWATTGPDRPWRVIDGTLVFADISGFTALSERLAKRGQVGAEELTDVLGRCFADLLAVAYAEGGSLLKFGGDALLLLFEGDGHAERGVRSAMAMQSVMRSVGRLTTSVGNVRLRMSLGVHTGDVHAFRVGRSHRELLLAGPGPSTVVDMEGTAVAGEIVVSPATAAQIDPRLLGETKGPGMLLRRRTVPMPEGRPYPARLAGGAIAESVPVVLREHLLSGGGESEHRHASIAFIHFDGTDGLLAERGPAWLADALEVLIVDAQRAAEAHGVTFLGTDLDHDGGKIILVAGVPRSLGDDEGRLLRAVREIASVERAVPVRIGVNRGPVFAGEVGPPYRRTFTVMGDAVNLAARLMAKAERGQILASAGVLDRSRTAFELTALEPFFVKGKVKAVQAFAVGAALGTQATRRSAQLPLVGRETEMAALTAAWDDARGGAGRAVEIVGEAGVGRSRLVEETRTRAVADGGQVRLIQCEQYEASTPFFAIRLLVAAALGGTDDLAGRLEALAPELLEWLPLIGDVVGDPQPENERTRDLDPRFRRELTNRAVADVLAAAIPGPAVLAFDDVQWIDDASAAALAVLADDATSLAWLVLTTRRTDVPAPAEWRERQILLDPLSDDAAAALITGATTERPLRPERQQALLARAGGNPLFLEELLAVATEGDDLPDSLEAVVAADLDRLAPDDGRLVRVAAVLGSSFEAGLFAEISGANVGEGWASSPLGAHLILQADGRLRFRHRLLRDVAYGLLPHRRRQELHARAADAITAGVDDPNDRAEVLSLHYLHARRYDDASRLAGVAADRARRKFALVEARELYERAITAGRRADHPVAPRRWQELWTRLGNVRQLLGDFDAANEAYTEVRQARRDDPIHQARMAYRHSEIAERQGRATSWARWIGRGLRALEGVDGPQADAERAHLLIRRSSLRNQLGYPKDALRWAQAAVDAAERSEEPSAMAEAYAVLDAAYIGLGRLDQAVYGERALRLYRQLRKRDSAAQLLNNLGALAYYEGRWSDAVRLYEEARANFERVGNLVDAAMGSSNMAEIFADQGHLDDAERLLVEVIARWRALSFPLGTARATRYLARVHLRRGDPAAALEAFDAARSVFEGHGLIGNVHEVDVWRAECLLQLGDEAKAASVADSAMTLEQSLGGTEWGPALHRVRSALACRAGRLEDAWAELDASLDLARRRGAVYDEALGLEALADLARTGGRSAAEADEARLQRDRLLAGLGVVATQAGPVAGV